MKSILVIYTLATLLCISSVLCHGQAAGDCLKESGMTAQRIELLLNSSSQAVPTQKEKCYFKCELDQLPFYKNGKADVDAATAEICKDKAFMGKEAEVRVMVEECNNAKGIDDCDTAYKQCVCAQNHSSVMGVVAEMTAGKSA